MLRGISSLVISLVLLFLVSACGTVTPTPSAAPKATLTATPSGAMVDETPEPAHGQAIEDEELIAARTPAPTVTPGVIAQEVNEILSSTGLDDTTILGLPATDWANLVASLLIVLGGYLIGTLLIRRVLPRAAERTATPLDDRLLNAIGSDVRWVIVLVALHYATIRLTFLSAELKTLLTDIYFVIDLALVFRIAWSAINLTSQWYRQRAADAGRSDELEPIITLLSRLALLVALVFGLIILLGHFGINVTGFAAALGIGGLALSLAAQDTLADTISGFIILIDRPFRVGDRIEIQGEGTWGDVLEIGIRTTRIRTRDNRMVIVPNSIIGKNQVVNYTYPDPRYRIETHVGLPYGTDIEEARSIIIETVRKVPGVLHDRPVDALYIEMGASAMIFRVRWWIESYVDTRRMFDHVHTALQQSLDTAGVDSAYTKYDVNVNLRGGALEERSEQQPPPDPPA
jgi:small-conductance mechanosensitive channel